MSARPSEKQEYIDKLRAELKPGDTVYTVLRSVSRSGMSRQIDVYHFAKVDQGRVDKAWLSYWAAKALGWRFNNRADSITVSGCGMDMGFHLIYCLSATIFADLAGKPIDPAWGHIQGGTNANGTVGDPGYLLNQEWL